MNIINVIRDPNIAGRVSYLPSFAKHCQLNIIYKYIINVIQDPNIAGYVSCLESFASLTIEYDSIFIEHTIMKHPYRDKEDEKDEEIRFDNDYI